MTLTTGLIDDRATDLYELHEGCDYKVPEDIDPDYSKGGQLGIFNDPARFKIVVAGRRWGKTVLAIMMMIAEALEGKNKRIWYISPFLQQSQTIAWKLLKSYLPPHIPVKINESRLIIDFLGNGSEIALKGADKPESLEGAGLHLVVMDEYFAMKHFAWEESIAPMLTDTQGKALFIGKARGKDHSWQLWVDGKQGIGGFKSWRFPSIDNPLITKEEIEGWSARLNERFYRQEWWASFEDYTGLVYPEFDHKVHVINEFPDVNNMNSLLAIDPATTGIHAWLQGYVSKDDVFYLVREFYEENKRVSDVVPTLPPSNRYLIDPNYGAQKLIPRAGKLYSFIDEYRERGINVLPGEEDVDGGINRIGEYFKSNKIVIYKGCKNLINELTRYHWSEQRVTVRGVSKPRPYKKDDHLVDCLRYIVMSRAHTPEDEAPKMPLREYKQTVDYEMNKQKEEENWKLKYA